MAAALADGTIDAVASDHQPRDADDKRFPFAQASAGGAGLATLLGVTLAQVHSAGCRWPRDRAADGAPGAPARQPGGAAGEGRAGRSVPVRPGARLAGRGGNLPGKARNTPFDGRALEGRVIGTWKAGRRVFG